MRKLIPGLLACLTLFLASPGVSRADDPPPLQVKSPEIVAFLHARQPKPYTRIARPDTNTVQLQIAVRRMVPTGREGAGIWLVGTSHIGETNYYQALQNILNDRTVVLYEGVNTGAHQRHVPKASPPAPTDGPAVSVPGKTNAGFSMQPALAHALGLVFQLDAIDYDRTNFLNSDLSVLQIQRLMIGDPDAKPAEPGEEGRSDSTFNSLIQIMDGSSFLGSLLKVGIEWIGASTQLQAVTKLTLIETLGQLKGDFADMRGLPAEMRQLVQVLIAARNENVVNDLKTELRTVPPEGSVAIFYGTGHMDDMERRIRGELSYEPAEDIWLTAFSVDLRKTGMDPSQLKYIEKMISTELSMMQAGGSTTNKATGEK